MSKKLKSRPGWTKMGQSGSWILWHDGIQWEAFRWGDLSPDSPKGPPLVEEGIWTL